MWTVNTSNPGKQKEYEKFFSSDQIRFLHQDLAEPLADALTILRFKASQFDEVIVDDVSFEVEGEEVGVNIRWLLKELPKYVGKRARFVCYIGLHRNNQIEIYRAQTEGNIVEPQGNSYGFNNYFLPDGATKTFGQESPDTLNPRFRAVQDLLRAKSWKVAPPLKNWDGKFQ